MSIQDKRYTVSSVGIHQTREQAFDRLVNQYGVLIQSLDEMIGDIYREAKQEFRDAGYKGCGSAARLVYGGKVVFWYAGKNESGWRFIERH
jgi:hypothetical protein